MQLLLFLVHAGQLTAEQLVAICDACVSRQVPIGKIALRSRALTIKQIFEVLSIQATEDTPFGEIAVRLGFLSRQKLTSLLRLQSEQFPSLEETAIELGYLSADQLAAARVNFRRGRCQEILETVQATFSVDHASQRDLVARRKAPQPRRSQVGSTTCTR